MIRRDAAPDVGTLERLALIHQRAFAPHARGWSADEIRTLAVDGTLHISAHGFVIMRAVLDEAEVITIAIDPAAQGTGEGRALLTHALADQAGATVFLEVAANNAPALALYNSCGFAEVGRRRGYYRRPDGPAVDALTMQRPAC